MMNKKKFAALIGALGIMVSAYATPSMAVSLGFGATGGYTNVDAEGTEILNGQTVASNGQENLDGPMASIYAQITVGEEQFGEGNGFVLGYDMGLGEASAKVVRSGQINKLAPEASEEGSFRGEARVSNLNTIYFETPGFTTAGLYARIGWSELDVETSEDLLTDDTIGDGSMDGTTYGFGFKKSLSGFQVKTEFNYTDFDTLSLTSGSGTVYTATPEVWAAKIGIGYNF